MRGRIVVKELYSPQLSNTRKIRIYLPPSYEVSEPRRYPVLYMHDGQNIFSGSINIFGASWDVDTTAERLMSEGKIEEIIIVGIDNNSDRANEYCHVAPKKIYAGRLGYTDSNVQKDPKGYKYESFLIDTVKPFVDTNYKTLRDRDNTALMGSSLGGLVTYFIGLRRPDIFSKLGVVSPAFHWLNYDSLLELPKQPLKMWMDAGDGEAHYIENSRKVVKNLMSQGMRPVKDIAYYHVPNAIHNEKYWNMRIHMPLLYLFGKIGHPISCNILGRKEFGLAGMEYRQINPVLNYADDLHMTALEGEYKIEDESVLSIDSFGTVTPYRTGSTGIKFIYDGCSAADNFNVIDELSDKVTVKLRVTAPDTDEKLYVYSSGEKELTKESDGTYTGEFIVPRDWGIPFTVTKGDKHLSEADVNTGKYKSRVMYANDDMTVEIEIEAWCKQ